MKYEVPVMVEPVDVFCSFSKDDSDLQSRLQKHLAGLINQKLIRSWHNGMIDPGEEIAAIIAEKFEAADLVLLLISSSFLSDCWDEMEKAVDRYDSGEAKVVPILLRPCFCPDAPYHKLNPLPEDGVFITACRNRDKAFASVMEGIRQEIVDRPIYKLPLPETTFVGRERELRDLEDLLKQGERLIVLHGPAGSGKTRLALELAERLSRRFRHGVCYVSLRQAKTVAALPVIIAQALEEAKEGEDSPLEKSLRRFLRPKQMLLLLDACDRVPDADLWLNDLLKECTGLRVLVTSRKPWKKAKTSYRLSPSLEPSDAVKLFVQNAPAAGSRSEPWRDETTVAEICADLQGLALAVELVAAQADQFRSPEALERLSRLDRQRDPLRAAVSWIVGLLAPGERKLFSRLSVFPGSFTAEAAAAICAAGDLGLDLQQGLGSLREKRLLRPEGGDRSKMPDVLRLLAAELLDEREKAELEQRHFDFFLNLVETVEPKLTSAERPGWLERLEAENENLRAALAWSQKRPDAEPGLRLAGSLFWFWNLRAYFSEGRRWLEPALKKGRPKRSAGRARALYAAGGLAFLQGDQDAAQAWLEESVDLWREIGDPKRLGFALIILGMVAQQENAFEDALACEKESVDIFRRLHDEWGLALALNDLGNAYRAKDDHAAAIELYRQSLPKWRKMNDPWGLPLTLDNLGYLEMIKGDKTAAHRAFRESLKVRFRVDDRWGLPETIKYLADLAVRQKEDDQAERLYRESLDLNRKIGRKPLMVGCLAGLAGVALRQGALREAARLSGAVDALRGAPRPSSKLLDHEMYEETRKALRERSRDASALRYARSLGKKASLEEITTYALALPSLTTPAERPTPPPAPERKASPEVAQQGVPELVKAQR